MRLSEHRNSKILLLYCLMVNRHDSLSLRGRHDRGNLITKDDCTSAGNDSSLVVPSFVFSTVNHNAI